MGKKYIIEIGRLERLYKAFVSAHGKPEITWLSPEVDLTPYTEPDLEQVRKEAYADGYKEGRDAKFRRLTGSEYQRGLNDAWEAARTLWNTPARKKIFGYTMFSTAITTLTGQEAIEKIRQYEQEKDAEIKVGDEVIPHHITADSTPVIVTRKWKDDYNQDAIHTIGYDGRTNCFLEEHVKKTGRHFEIAEVLAKMKETNNAKKQEQEQASQ